MIDGHDIELYSDAASAAVEIEGYDAPGLTILGVDGTVFEVVVEGPEWGPASVRDTGRNGLRDLVTLLRAEAAARSVSFPADLPNEPTAIWQAVIDAQLAQRTPPRQWGKPHR